MKYSALLALLFVITNTVMSQDVAPLLAEAAQQEKNLKEADALQTYQSVLKLEPDNVTALYRAAELSGRLGSRLKDDHQKIGYFTAAKQFAQTALKQKHQIAEAYFVLAYSSMKMATITKGKEKAADLSDMKSYADSALLFTPEHAGALYIAGKWNSEILNLNTGEKAAVKILFGGMPRASADAAILYFEKARKANPWMLVTYLDLAKTYVQQHLTGKAIEVLQKMVKMPPRTGDDESLKTEGRKLLESLQ